MSVAPVAGVLRVLLCLGFPLTAGCELDEVAAPRSEDLLVVDAVLRAGAAEQKVLLHRSLDGREVRGERGATVLVSAEDGTRVTFSESPLTSCADLTGLEDVEVRASCYLAADFRPRPGAAYTLEIQTTSGERVRGRTVVPGSFSFVSPALTLNPTALVADCRLPEQPFTLVWGASEGAWAYVVTLGMRDWAAEGSDLPDPVELTSVSVSAADTTLLFPANVGLFQRGDLDSRVFDILRSGLPSAGESTLVVMAIDRNYTNAIRGGRFNPSGNVRLSSVAGDGVGVFGSVVPITIRSGARFGSAPCPGALPPGSE